MENPHSAILAACEGPMAVFADFDGTLVDIAPSPDAVEVPSELIPRLDRLSAALDGAFAIISGRTIADIDRFLASPHIAISGSHGAERRHDGDVARPDPALREAVTDIETAIAAKMGDDDRILVETKPTGVALHFRAAPEREAEAREAINAAVQGHDAFHVIAGKKVFEARPVSANKGAAVEALAANAPFAGRMPVFIGDDVTDEDGFLAAYRMGGFGVKVGPGETAARFRLDDVGSVHALFDAIAERQSRVEPAPRKATPLKESTGR